MPSLTVGRGIGTARRDGTSLRASTPISSAVSSSRAEVVVTGMDPARGNSTATTPSTTTPEMTARSARDRPHGGTSASSTRAATSPTGGRIHSSRTEAAVTTPSAPRKRRSPGFISRT